MRNVIYLEILTKNDGTKWDERDREHFDSWSYFSYHIVRGNKMNIFRMRVFIGLSQQFEYANFYTQQLWMVSRFQSFHLLYFFFISDASVTIVRKNNM